MDFFGIESARTTRGNTVSPIFFNKRSKDFMVRGKAFYAIWNEETGLWSRDELDVVNAVDSALGKAYEEEGGKQFGARVFWMRDTKGGQSNSYNIYLSWVRNLPDMYHPLDTKVTYLSQTTTKKDYASKRLPYDLSDSKPEAYNELMSTLYDPKERRKLEWATGAVLNGDASMIQKMLVLYGPPGSGKSTFLHILEQLLQGYTTTFDARSLTSGKGEFATHFFRNNPLVAIQHDGILTKIEDNSLLNSIVSHEDIVVNEKFKAQYTDRARCMLFLGTNSPVKISDSKSGLIRRLIDVHPSGRKVDPKLYFDLMDRIPFELGAIANHCIKVYRRFGKRYYDNYRPLSMMYATDVFFNFVADNRLIFEADDPISLERIYAIYKQYCDETNATFISQRYKFRDEMENYYERYDSELRQFFGFKSFILDEDDDNGSMVSENEENGRWIILDCRESLLDKVLEAASAQYGNKDEIPFEKWENVKKTLKEIDTSKLHYVRVPENHIVIDFDLKNEKGEKDAILNLEAANKWPPTYAEYSKGGSGIHLHYIYSADPSILSRIYDESGIEVKVFTGNSSLRRKLTLCNNIPIATLSGGLPLKEDKKVINESRVKDEQHLRALIAKNLRKEIHPHTKPSVDYIYKLLNDAYTSGMAYDVRDMRQKVLTFAMKSTNQKDACLKLVNDMHFCSENEAYEDAPPVDSKYADERLVFFDCEVFPNLFVVCWMFDEDGVEPTVMINPSPEEIGKLFKYKLVGFNNRRYDNHICYARYLGWSNEKLYELSTKIVGKREGNGFFKEAYNLSYTDVYDFASAVNKMGLKKWEIKLNLHHQECPYPWDQPVPEDKWIEVGGYCSNDVKSTRATFHELIGDWTARLMLAKMAGGTPNDTTNQLSTKFVFEGNRNPELVYTDLTTGRRSDGTHDPNFFPDYEYRDGKNYFRGEDVGRGGYVWAKPGMYKNTYTFDVAGMHPASIIALNYFGKYTPRFKEMVGARTLIKHKDFEAAKKVLNGVLAEYLTDPGAAKSVSNALKTANNSCYGLTSASFPNPMKHPDNVNNIVALRGALFICQLKNQLIEMGVEVIHCKTDSIKVVDPSKEVVDYIYEQGHTYGYDFEIEHHFDRICLVNDAVYIAKLAHDDPDAPGEWTATGAQFQHPYIFKTLFSKEELTFKDLCETKEVSNGGAIYLDFNEDLSAEEHDYHFVGRVGLFTPIQTGRGGAELMVKRDDKYSAVTGTKGYRWLESEQVRLMSLEDSIDMSYFHRLADKAIDAINQYGDFEHFVGESEYVPEGGV